MKTSPLNTSVPEFKSFIIINRYIIIKYKPTKCTIITFDKRKAKDTDINKKTVVNNNINL